MASEEGWSTVSTKKASLPKTSKKAQPSKIITKVNQFCKDAECKCGVTFVLGCCFCGQNFGATKKDMVHRPFRVKNSGDGKETTSHCTPVEFCDFALTGETDDEGRTLAIFASPRYNNKIIFSRPGADYVEWIDTWWMTEHYPTITHTGCICDDCVDLLCDMEGVSIESN
jgi:hypothetical protein